MDDLQAQETPQGAALDQHGHPIHIGDTVINDGITFVVQGITRSQGFDLVWGDDLALRAAHRCQVVDHIEIDGPDGSDVHDDRLHPYPVKLEETPNSKQGQMAAQPPADIDFIGDVTIDEWHRAGECEWGIDLDGCLWITPADGKAVGTFEKLDYGDAPWFDLRSEIVEVRVPAGVKVVLPVDSSGLFSYCTHLVDFDARNFDTSLVENMSEMFYGCHRLGEVDLSGWDTSGVIRTSGMFRNCYELADLNLSGWDTAHVVNAESMFEGCNLLSRLDLSDFDLSNVRIADYMFFCCRSLSNLTLDMSTVSDRATTAAMFDGCSSLHSINDTHRTEQQAPRRGRHR